MAKENLGVNGNYQIINKVSTGTGFDIVLATKEHYPISEYRYVTWIQNDRGYDAGHYFDSLKEAQFDMIERASNIMHLDLHEKWYNEFVENDITSALSEFLSVDEVKELKNNDEFMANAKHQYLKADVGVDQAIIECMRDLYESYKDCTVLNFDEDLEEIEME